MRVLRNLAGLLFVTVAIGLTDTATFANPNCTITSGYGTATVEGTCENGCGDALLACSDYCNYTYSSIENTSCIPGSFECADNPGMGTVNFSCGCTCLYGD